MKKKTMLWLYYTVIMLICLISTLIHNTTFSLVDYNEPAYEYKEACEFYQKTSIEENKEFIYNETHYQFDDESCEYIIKNYDKTGSFYLYYDQIIESGFFSFLFPLFVPVLVLIPILFNLSKEFQSEYIKYFLQRNTYKKYIMHLFKESYKYFFPIFIILIYIIIYALILSNGNFDPRMDMYLNRPVAGNLDFYYNPSNVVIYFMVILLNVLLYINLGLISLSHNKNFFIALIESFLLVFIYIAFTFIVIGINVQIWFGILSENINVGEIYTWHGIREPITILLFTIGYYLTSLFLVYISYKNKEKIVMLCEE